MMIIDLLYFDDCPSWEKVMADLETIQKEGSLEFSIHLLNMKSDEEASRLKFLGSPSIQINGIDLWPEDRPSYAMNCRMYQTADGLKGWPTLDMIRQKLIERSKASGY